MRYYLVHNGRIFGMGESPNQLSAEAAEMNLGAYSLILGEGEIISYLYNWTQDSIKNGRLQEISVQAPKPVPEDILEKAALAAISLYPNNTFQAIKLAWSDVKKRGWACSPLQAKHAVEKAINS